ncbi:MAG: hypothetical protein GX595_06810 [Lentisphaerae bacterium]|nr:hypothetical protein [Lentisphaerota bacterium]
MQRKNTAKGKRQVTVRGVVAPTEWDMRDEVVAVTLYSHDENEYLVTDRAMVQRLMKYMDEEVEAHGVLTEDDYGNEVLEATDFTPVEADSDDDDEAPEIEDLSEDEDLEDEEDEDWDEEDEDEDDEPEADEGAWADDEDEKPRRAWRKPPPR